MADTNGTGRLDRIEALLDKLARIQERDHEEFTRDHRQLVTWQVLMQEKMDRWAEAAAKERKRLDALNESTDQLIAQLVVATSELIRNR